MKIDNLFVKDNRPIIKLQDKGVKFYLNNPDPNKIDVYIVKGEETAYRDGQERCDYILKAKKPDKSHLVYVELKGNKINKAISQIETTHLAFRDQLKSDLQHAFVVSNQRLPKTSSKEQNKKLIFLKNYYIRLDFCRSGTSFSFFAS